MDDRSSAPETPVAPDAAPAASAIVGPARASPTAEGDSPEVPAATVPVSPESAAEEPIASAGPTSDGESLTPSEPLVPSGPSDTEPATELPVTRDGAEVPPPPTSSASNSGEVESATPPLSSAPEVSPAPLPPEGGIAAEEPVSEAAPLADESSSPPPLAEVSVPEGIPTSPESATEPSLLVEPTVPSSEPPAPEPASAEVASPPSPVLEPEASPRPPVPPPEAPPPAVEPAPTTPEPGPAPPAPVAIELLSGGSLLASLQPFLDAAAAGLRGLAVVRESPERIRAHAGNRPIEVYWLTNFGRGPSLRPGDLDLIQAFLEKAIVDLGVAVFFIEGVEYLIRLHGIARVVALLVEFDRRLREREARAWVHLTPDLLSAGDLEQLRAALV
jgi:hypothetical protein